MQMLTAWPIYAKRDQTFFRSLGQAASDHFGWLPLSKSFSENQMERFAPDREYTERAVRKYVAEGGKIDRGSTNRDKLVQWDSLIYSDSFNDTSDDFPGINFPPSEILRF